jgi:DNA-directed RNA polymerase specialized sigma24 family protein
MSDPSFADFVGDSLPALGRYAYALTGDVHTAEDLVQDTLVRLSGVWSRVRRDGNPRAYARAVMFRLFVSRWRIIRRPATIRSLRRRGLQALRKRLRPHDTTEVDLAAH